jgi:hypothetical protein
LLTFVALAGVLAGCGSSDKPAQTPQENVASAIPDDADFRLAVDNQLSDPRSAQFEDVEVGSNAICGEINAKNQFGGYTGFKAFVFERKTKRLWVEDSADADAAYEQIMNAMRSCPNFATLFERLANKTIARSQSFITQSPTRDQSERKEAQAPGPPSISGHVEAEEAPAPHQEYESVPASDPRIKRWLALETKCRGGGDWPSKIAIACHKRDLAEEALNAAGICYGLQDQDPPDYAWHYCGPNSNR